MESIIHKLDNFIRKYHFSLLLKNLLFFIIFSVLLILFFTFVEYSLWLNSAFRKVIFIVFLFSVLFSGVWYLFLPFLKLSRFSKRIDRYKAADIIGKFFPEIQDKFRNLLELSDIQHVSRENRELLEAAINQKSNSLGFFQIQKALDFSKLKRAGFLFLPVVLGFFMLTFTRPEVVQDSFTRILNFNSQYVKPAPFDFVLLNNELTGIHGQSETIKLSLEGNNIPGKVMIYINGISYPMKKVSTSQHQFTIHQLKDNFEFKFEANGFLSDNYRFKVIKKPTILSFAAELIYPAYTGKQNEIKKNTTDYQVPQGTKIKWTFRGKDIHSVEAISNENKESLKSLPVYPNIFDYTGRFLNTGKLIFTASNQYIQDSDSLQMFIDVIPDNYPAIEIEEIRDSLLINRVYFTGNISDDYGFTSVRFYSKSSSQKEFIETPIPFSQQINEQKIFFMFDFSTLENWREEEVEYFFAVTDNDAINGNKTTKSFTKKFSMPGKEELNESYQQKQDYVVSEMMKVLNEARQIQSEIDILKFELLNKKTLNWEDRNKFDQLLQQQQNLEKKLENLKDENLNKNLFEEQIKDLTPELLEKQRQLEEMFNKLFSEEMKEIIRQIQEMLQDLNKEQIMEHMEKMQMRTEDIEKKMDENLELFKQLDFEKKFEEMMDDLNKLKEKLDQLSEKTEEKNSSNENLREEQDKINKEFEDIKKNIETLEKLNEDLFDPMNFPDADDLMNEISKDLEDAKSNLSKNRNQQAGKNQKSGSEKMQKLSDMMQNAMDSYAMESLEEDIENLKMILKNLIHISFAQERNMDLGKGMGPRDPNYNQVMVNQKRLMTRFKIVEDSLHALSKRQIMIQPLIAQDLALIRDNSSKIDTYLNFGAIAAAVIHQQYLMQSVNNLALLLIEALKEMNDMMMQADGSGSCKSKQKKPGSKPGSSPSAKTMRQLQEQLNQQMEELMKQMQSGKTGKDGMGGKNISENLAKMAAEQEAIRRQLQQYSDMLKSMGEGESKTLNEIMRQMEQTEKDLVNKKLDLNTIKRQNDILVRLMESEKAELEREKEEKRSSRTGKVINTSNPEEFFKYKRDRTTSEEIIKSIPPSFNSFYRQKVNNFYYELNK